MIVTARNVYGELLLSPFTVTVERLGRSRSVKTAKDVPPNGRAEFAVAWQQTYRVRVVSEGHAAGSCIVGGSTNDIEVVLPIEPSAVVGFDWPDPLPQIDGVDWRELGPERRGALLNIHAKMWSSSFGVTPVVAYLERVLEVRPDRIICTVSPAIIEAMATSVACGEVDDVSSAVGHDPPAGYSRGPAIKTQDDEGNLQISTFVTDDAGAPTLADIDIDERRGIGHVFDVIEHHATRTKTNMIEIQQILAATGVDAGWRPLLV